MQSQQQQQQQHRQEIVLDDLLSTPLSPPGTGTTSYQSASEMRTITTNGVQQTSQPSLGEPNAPNVFQQLTATMKRQWIQKFRMPGSLLVEMLLPLLFIAGLVAGNQAAGTSENPG